MYLVVCFAAWTAIAWLALRWTALPAAVRVWLPRLLLLAAVASFVVVVPAHGSLHPGPQPLPGRDRRALPPRHRGRRGPRLAGPERTSPLGCIRAFVIVVMLVATHFQLGTHFDNTPVTRFTAPFSRRQVVLEPHSWAQYRTLIVLPP